MLADAKNQLDDMLALVSQFEYLLVELEKHLHSPVRRHTRKRAVTHRRRTPSEPKSSQCDPRILQKLQMMLATPAPTLPDSARFSMAQPEADRSSVPLVFTQGSQCADEGYTDDRTLGTGFCHAVQWVNASPLFSSWSELGSFCN